MKVADQVRLLLLSRDYRAAERVARDADPTGGERARLLRMCLARQERFADAAEAGREALNAAATPEDFFRQAQILMRIGRASEALSTGLIAVQARPNEARYIVPVVEAVLLDPALLPVLTSAIGGRARPADLPEHRGAPAVNLPVDLPHYVQGLNGRHPWVMGLAEAAAAEISFDCTADAVGDLAGAVLAGLPRALQCVDRLTEVHALIDRCSAAAYVAHRFLSSLYSTVGSVDLLPFLPFSLAERPFVVLFDFLGNLFSPFQPFEDTDISSRRSALYWIVRSSLESPLCRGIVTNYLEAGPLLGGFFGSPEIEAKSVFINPVHLPDAVSDAARATERQPRGQREEITLLFTSSVRWTDEGFYYRGGVDVLNAFLDLSNAWPKLRLVLRSPLPANLSVRLRQAVESHTRITWLPDRIPWSEYEELLGMADLFVMPSILMYRNGLVQTMTWGIVPVIADCLHATEMVEDGATGAIIRGRGHRGTVMAADQRLVTDWGDLLRATDRPADPTFYDRYRSVLAELVGRPEKIRELSRNILAADNRHDFGAADQGAFARLMRKAMDESPGLSTSPEAAFPIQPRVRPGDPVLL